jgi:hypothetical protein
MVLAVGETSTLHLGRSIRRTPALGQQQVQLQPVDQIARAEA